jgi:hypothetical protein
MRSRSLPVTKTNKIAARISPQPRKNPAPENQPVVPRQNPGGLRMPELIDELDVDFATDEASLIDELDKLDAATLGKMLDEVDRESNEASWVDGLKLGHPRLDDICHRHYAIRNAYFGAIRAPLLSHVAKLERAGRIVSGSQWSDSYRAHNAAKLRLDLMDLDGPHYFTAREHCDASAAAEYAEAIEEMYFHRQGGSKRVADLFQTAPKSRVAITPKGKRKTGKFKRGPNGTKIPLVE